MTSQVADEAPLPLVAARLAAAVRPPEATFVGSHLLTGQVRGRSDL